jgi:DNA-binding transcriptional ArsR family regulator
MVAKSGSARRHEQGKAAPDARPRLGAVRGQAGSAPLALDQLIHERKRLAIVSALAVHDALSFTELRAAVGTSDGNLSVHARKLEDAGYIDCRKGFAGRVPRTEFRLTAVGRRALAGYLDHMEALIRRTREA